MQIRLRLILIVLPCLFNLVAPAQVRHIPAVKITQSIKIDGDLNDAAWQSIESTGDFITSSPVFGKASTHKTQVKIAYDNSAVYIGAYLYENPDDIRRQITARDIVSMQNADYFLVGFDTYHDRQNAFVFRVTAAGTQGDAKESQNGANGSGTVFDASWDAVWESKTSIKNDGWVVEIKIPFSAIRFSKKNLQDWGINFARFIRKENENSIWSPVNPNINGDINQWGDWVGLKNITPPLRLSFLPYLSGGFRVSPTQKGNVTEYLKSGGMDVKYGINESFTLDMTLIPDFAQVQSDNVYLNLSPFEVKFDDYRPFFTEGTELFNKAGLFYSRRVGAAPGGASGVLNKYGHDPLYKIDKNPGITRLYNATKFSGRTKGKLGIGIFNAITVPMYARVTNLGTGIDTSILTDPLTNYNILVLDQALKHRSSIGFTNTNVLRKGNSRNANVSSLDVSLFDKKNLHNFSFTGKYSSIWGKQIHQNGFYTVTGFGKVSGLIQYNGSVGLISDSYNPNDLGFLQNNNSFYYSAAISYNKLKPTRYFLNHIYKLNLTSKYLYKPFLWTNTKLDASAFYLFRNFWDITFSANIVPQWTRNYFVNSGSYNGYFLNHTPYVYLAASGSSDSRKKTFFNWKLGGAKGSIAHDAYWENTLGLRYRFSNKFQLSGSSEFVGEKGNWGWSFMNNPDGSPIIAHRNIKTNTTILSGQYNFNARMNLNVRMRHYWTWVKNKEFYNLKNDGYWSAVNFIPGKDVNFNTFNLDLFYTWDFLLGSRLTIAWKNALGGNAYVDPYSSTGYFNNLGKVINSPHSNELTVKMVYFLDYLTLRKKK